MVFSKKINVRKFTHFREIYTFLDRLYLAIEKENIDIIKILLFNNKLDINLKCYN